MAKLLLVDDDQDLVSLIQKALSDEKYTVDTVFTAGDARAYLDSVTYDAVILDWSLPDAEGVDVCREYRGNGGMTPILFLTGHAATTEKTTGLDAGADDYLTKPFAMAELLSRVRALLRRPPQIQRKVLSGRDITLDPSTRTVVRAGNEISLYPKEFSLLELFLLHPNQVFSVDTLLNRVWPTDSDASVETVRQTILRLRQKVESDAANPLIQTVRGVGYRLRP